MLCSEAFSSLVSEHHQVEDNGVHGRCGNRIECLLATVGAASCESSGFQHLAHVGDGFRVVVDDEDFTGGLPG